MELRSLISPVDSIVCRIQHAQGLKVTSILIRVHGTKACVCGRARPFRVSEICRGHSGGRSQSFVRETVKSFSVCAWLHSKMANHLNRNSQIRYPVPSAFLRAKFISCGEFIG